MQQIAATKDAVQKIVDNRMARVEPVSQIPVAQIRMVQVSQEPLILEPVTPESVPLEPVPFKQNIRPQPKDDPHRISMRKKHICVFFEHHRDCVYRTIPTCTKCNIEWPKGEKGMRNHGRFCKEDDPVINVIRQKRAKLVGSAERLNGLGEFAKNAQLILLRRLSRLV
ncbi:uncharacterized protein LOC124459934 [Drosophila willistoni]|uniref:uncharacterized protein LOC124459934 n=1 Tax=Drosophila willistoni TaxID=7260 RepID=UPI001F07EBF0|nr:uncharacterized protein LOC124459934 [Drosophila willistoni]